jgi:hypothetical protein
MRACDVKRFSACKSSSAIAKRLSGQLDEQRIGVLQISSVEAFGEPVVNVGEYHVSLFAAALLFEQPREAHGRAQFQ